MGKWVMTCLQNGGSETRLSQRHHCVHVPRNEHRVDGRVHNIHDPHPVCMVRAHHIPARFAHPDHVTTVLGVEAGGGGVGVGGGGGGGGGGGWGGE